MYVYKTVIIEGTASLLPMLYIAIESVECTFDYADSDLNEE